MFALREEPRQFPLPEHVLARRAPGQQTKIPDEVRLIGVTAGGGGVRSSARYVATIEQAQGALKSRETSEALRGDTDGVQKSPFEMAPRQARRGGEGVD